VGMLGVADKLPVVDRLVVVGKPVVEDKLVGVGMLVVVGILVGVHHNRQRSGEVEGMVEDSRVLGSGVLLRLIHRLILQ
jgi:hypothetical protein